MRLKDKVCIITGAAGGMGTLATEMFCREGARVVAGDINRELGEQAAERATSQGPGQAVFLESDVSKEDDCKRLSEEALRRFGRIDVLYNNAGIMPADDHSVVDTTVAAWERVQQVNVGSVFLCSKYAVPAMIEAGGGSIVNVASFVANMGCSVPQDAYTASKGAVVSLTHSMAVQFGPMGIRTNAICPGPIESSLMSELLTDIEARSARLRRIPLGRFGKPEDAVYLAIYLASDESSWTNGASIIVDGGISCNYF